MWTTPSANTRTLTRHERQQFHDAVFAVSDRCSMCGAPAVIADHIVPIAFGGMHDPVLNGQPLCQPCSDTKSRAEALEGRRRTGYHRGAGRREPERHPGVR